MRGEGVGGQEVLGGKEQGLVLIQSEGRLSRALIARGRSALLTTSLLLSHTPTQAFPAAQVKAGEDDTDRGGSTTAVDTEAHIHSIRTSSSAAVSYPSPSPSIFSRRSHGQGVAGGSEIGVP